MVPLVIFSLKTMVEADLYPSDVDLNILRTKVYLIFKTTRPPYLKLYQLLSWRRRGLKQTVLSYLY